MSGFSRDPDRCDCNTIHDDVVRSVQLRMPDEDLLIDLADLFKVFSDSTRVRILSALFHAEMCVCDMAVLLGMTKSSISHQLRVLKQCRLVRNRKDGRIVYYSLKDEHVRNIFDQGLVHLSEG